MIEALGIQLMQAAEQTGQLVRLWLWAAWCAIDRLVRWRFRFRSTLEQMYEIAVKSLPVLAFALTFVGIIITLEFSFHMKMVLRQDSLVPSFSTVLLIRELGPVITCLLLSSRVGASIAAEIATMQVTDQIAALKMLAIDPVEYLVLPRWIATVFAAVTISILSVAVAILAGSFIASVKLNIPQTQYFNTMFTFTRFSDFQWILIKATVFGSLIPIIAAFEGFRTDYGAEGVGSAATKAVVRSTIGIIVLDFVITYALQ